MTFQNKIKNKLKTADYKADQKFKLSHTKYKIAINALVVSCENVTARSVTAALQLHEHEPITEDTPLSRSPGDLESASRYRNLNRTDVKSPTPTNTSVDWTSIQFDRRQSACAKKILYRLRVQHFCRVG
jgi:hypothetical protein